MLAARLILEPLNYKRTFLFVTNLADPLNVYVQTYIRNWPLQPFSKDY